MAMEAAEIAEVSLFKRPLSADGVTLCQHADWSRTEKLNVADCSKTGNLRVGETKNPGPRSRAVAPRSGSRFDYELLAAYTLVF